ncbi:hypothetical protein CVT25_002575 [Psilocybe cyanescens]|uniref:Uncharacterized protein n=1 Tax=Psilocybe cyanescens TaxID=93625 RepID=A0A409WLF8_PSICY|nr:hypothetical protein CVT25_002575 [Psilocybe cyanescens]
MSMTSTMLSTNPTIFIEDMENRSAHTNLSPCITVQFLQPIIDDWASFYALTHSSHVLRH